MPLPAVPDDIPIGRQRANYIVEHYWDNMPWKTAHTMPRKMENTVRDFADFITLAAPDTVLQSIDKLIKGASKKPESFKALMPIAEATFHSDTALFLNDRIYLPFAKAAATYKKLPAEERERYAAQALILESSSEGQTLPALTATRRDGSTFALNDTTPKAQSYVIIIETPGSDRFDRVRFAANVATRQLITARIIKPILIYAGEAPEEWWKSTEGLSRKWNVGQMPDAEKYFDLSQGSAIYMLSPRMEVQTKWMPMPTLISNCEQLLQAIKQQMEQ